MNELLLIDPTRKPRNSSARILADLIGVNYFTSYQITQFRKLGYRVCTTERIIKSSLVLTTK